MSLSAKKQKQTCLWGWTLKNTTTSTTTCTSPAQDTVNSDCTVTTTNESFESIQDKESNDATVSNENKTVANKNDNSIVEDPTQILLGQEIEGYTTTQGSTQENEWGNPEDNEGDKKHAAVDTKTSYHNFNEDASKDEVELIGVSSVVKTEASLIDCPV